MGGRGAAEHPARDDRMGFGAPARRMDIPEQPVDAPDAMPGE
jgi:hypothetical protein